MQDAGQTAVALARQGRAGGAAEIGQHGPLPAGRSRGAVRAMGGRQAKTQHKGQDQQGTDQVTYLWQGR